MRPPPPEVLWSRLPLYEEYADESDTGWEKFFANPDAPDYEGWEKFTEELDKKYRFENYYFQDYLIAIMNAKQGGYLVED